LIVVIFTFTFLSVILFILYRRLKQVEGLIMKDISIMYRLEDQDVQILDIRDPLDYEVGHISGAINIYIGRLPYVSKKELHRNQGIMIVSSSQHQINKAARILMKSGYKQLTGLMCKEVSNQNCHEQRKENLALEL
jgi:rhodanese-related sulfurtransferase